MMFLVPGEKHHPIPGPCQYMRPSQILKKKFPGSTDFRTQLAAKSKA
jgi:hypothetical protein